ncbi:MAG: TrmB family transcriptional regulator [Haloarculaceae archaeon]
MDRAQLTTVLEDAGLSPYQAEAYVTVLEMGSGQATNIADASGVPDPRIYDVLRDLEAKNYIETYEQETLYARAHSLEVVLEDLNTRARRYIEATDEIERRWEEPSMEDTVVSIVKRFETVLKNATEAIRSADRQVEVSLGIDQYERLEPALREATENGSMVNLSFQTGEAGVDALPARERLEDVCTEARHRSFPSPFVAIVDRSETYFAPHTGSINEYGVLVDDWTHTYVFHWFFLTTLWDVWEPYYADTADEPPIQYVDIRYCIRDVASLLENGSTVRVRVDGIDVRTGDERTVEGRVTDVETTSPPDFDGPASVAQFAGRAGITVETAEGPVEVGGWGATLEEVEATRITLLSVDD